MVFDVVQHPPEMLQHQIRWYGVASWMKWIVQETLAHKVVLAGILVVHADAVVQLGLAICAFQQSAEQAGSANLGGSMLVRLHLFPHRHRHNRLMCVLKDALVAQFACA